MRLAGRSCPEASFDPRPPRKLHMAVANTTVSSKNGHVRSRGRLSCISVRTVFEMSASGPIPGSRIFNSHLHHTMAFDKRLVILKGRQLASELHVDGLLIVLEAKRYGDSL